MSKTPLTDAEVYYRLGQETIDPDFTRKLEQDRAELLKALKGTLYLFEAHAVTKTDLEQIAFAHGLIARVEGKA